MYYPQEKKSRKYFKDNYKCYAIAGDKVACNKIIRQLNTELRGYTEEPYRVEGKYGNTYVSILPNGIAITDGQAPFGEEIHNAKELAKIIEDNRE